MPARQVLADVNMDDQIEEEERNLQDIVNNHRQFALQRLPNNEIHQSDQNLQIPNILKRKFELYITNGPNAKTKVVPIRQLKAELIGSYVQVRGMVTKVSDVRPIVSVACYFCEICGFEVYHTVTSKSYMPLVDCPSAICRQNNTKGKLLPNNRDSKFMPYQEIRVQETPDQIPQGSIPRSFSIVAKGETTRQATPGDIVVVTGVFLPAQIESFRGMSTKLIHDTYLEAFQIIREKKKYVDISITPELQSRIDEIRNIDAYSRMAKSIAPEIYGMDDVKKALLLLMVGGSTMQMQDGMKIRGDINIALIVTNILALTENICC
jgi:DNA replication licensing factor MCM7